MQQHRSSSSEEKREHQREVHRHCVRLIWQQENSREALSMEYHVCSSIIAPTPLQKGIKLKSTNLVFYLE